MGKTGIKESDIQRMICDYLCIRGYFFWRTNTTPIYDPTRQAFRAMPKYSKAGISDIILILKGKFIGLEVKRPKGVLGENQLLFKAGVEKAGGQYFVVKSVQDVINLGL